MASQLAKQCLLLQKKTVILQINGVHNKHECQYMLSTLKELPSIKNISISDRNSDTILLQVETLTGVNTLIHALNTISQFVAEASPANLDKQTVSLFYRWRAKKQK